MGDIQRNWKFKMLRFWYKREDRILQIFILLGIIAMIVIPYKKEVKAALLTVLLALGGCAGYGQPFTTQPSSFACVTVHWTEVAQIQAYCPPGATACATVGHVAGSAHIWIPKPMAFDDHAAVYKLGHELLHSLGATHK